MTHNRLIIQALTDQHRCGGYPTLAVLFGDNLALIINHGHHHALLMAGLLRLIGLDGLHILVGADNQIHAAFNALTNAAGTALIANTGGVC